jgi:hypothetical protein
VSNQLTDVVRECACGVKAILLICCWSTEIVAGVLDAEFSRLRASRAKVVPARLCYISMQTGGRVRPLSAKALAGSLQGLKLRLLGRTVSNQVETFRTASVSPEFT